MTIAKAVVTGTVFRTTEERSAQSGFTMYSFVIDIGEKEETLLRVISYRSSLSSMLNGLSKGDKVLVEGRLQTNNVKSSDGTERKVFELIASNIELMNSSSSSSSDYSTQEVVEFNQEEFADELISGEEIPF